MTPKEFPKDLKEVLDKIKDKEHDSVLKERELEVKDCLFNGFTTNRQEPMLIRKDLLYGYCYPPYKDVLGNWIVYS